MEILELEPPLTSRLGQIADSLSHLTESDMLLLADVTPSTLETWRKRGDGPAFVRAGNRFLYPRASVSTWLAGRVHVRRNQAAGAQP